MVVNLNAIQNLHRILHDVTTICLSDPSQGYPGRGLDDWFDGMTVTHQESGETILTGPIVDQSALFGLVFKASSLNLT